jgi:transposase
VGRTALSKRELQRGGVLARVKAGGLRLTDGAVLMRVSYRQAKRLWKRYQAGGVASLQHANAGRTSNRARPAKQRKKILQKVEEKYSGFGPTLAAEHLGMEDRLPVHPETLRRWMLSAGLWKKARQRKQHRRRRERRAHFGELVQMDGSFHDWYQGRAGKACLMNMVDDATSTVEARLGEQETIWAAARVLRQWIEKYGVPLALYTDWKNVYVREPTAKEQLHGQVPVTHFGGMRNARKRVPEAGYRYPRGELAASQGARGARQWDAPGSPDQEDGTQEDPHARSGESFFARRVSDRSQRTVCARAGRAAGLSPQATGSARTGASVLSGDRAKYFQ